MTADELEAQARVAIEELSSIRYGLRRMEAFALTRAQHREVDQLLVCVDEVAKSLRPRTLLADCRRCKGRGYVGGEENPSSCPNLHTDGTP